MVDKILLILFGIFLTFAIEGVVKFAKDREKIRKAEMRSIAREVFREQRGEDYGWVQSYCRDVIDSKLAEKEGEHEGD